MYIPASISWSVFNKAWWVDYGALRKAADPRWDLTYRRECPFTTRDFCSETVIKLILRFRNMVMLYYPRHLIFPWPNATIMQVYLIRRSIIALHLNWNTVNWMLCSTFQPIQTRKRTLGSCWNTCWVSQLPASAAGIIKWEWKQRSLFTVLKALFSSP